MSQPRFEHFHPIFIFSLVASLALQTLTPSSLLFPSLLHKVHCTAFQLSLSTHSDSTRIILLVACLIQASVINLLLKGKPLLLVSHEEAVFPKRLTV